MKTISVGDRVLWNDVWRKDNGEPIDTREWIVYDVGEDMAWISTGEPGKDGYAEAEVPLCEIMRYGVASATMAIRTAKNVVAALRKKGVKCDCDYDYKPISKLLRGCWYVDKLLQSGRTDCIHIELSEAGSFIAITNDCKLMTGCHVMINDAIESIYLEYVANPQSIEPYDSDTWQKCHFYTDEWGESGMVIMDPCAFVKWLNSLEFYERKETESIEPF